MLSMLLDDLELSSFYELNTLDVLKFGFETVELFSPVNEEGLEITTLELPQSEDKIFWFRRGQEWLFIYYGNNEVKGYLGTYLEDYEFARHISEEYRMLVGGVGDKYVLNVGNEKITLDY